MAGHSQFKNIMHRKGAQDAKKAKIFTKITREIVAAVHEGGGTNPEYNARLRASLIKARVAGLPKDRIQKAISNTQHEPTHYIRYDAYGPGGIALIIECATDNKNRIASEMRTILNKHNAKLESVEYLFRHLGCVRFNGVLTEDIELAAADANAEDIRAEGDEIAFYFLSENFTEGKRILGELGECNFDGMVWLPTITKKASDADIEKLTHLIDALEDHDDVQDVWTNSE